jgi:hypothetical protein
VEQVTLKDIDQALKAWLAPERLRFLLLGADAPLLQAAERAGLKPSTILGPHSQGASPSTWLVLWFYIPSIITHIAIAITGGKPWHAFPRSRFQLRSQALPCASPAVAAVAAAELAVQPFPPQT